jgi:hypothetical protein
MDCLVALEALGKLQIQGFHSQPDLNKLNELNGLNGKWLRFGPLIAYKWRAATSYYSGGHRFKRKAQTT